MIAVCLGKQKLISSWVQSNIWNIQTSVLVLSGKIKELFLLVKLVDVSKSALLSEEKALFWKYKNRHSRPIWRNNLPYFKSEQKQYRFYLYMRVVHWENM